MSHIEPRYAGLGSDLDIPLLEAEQVPTARQEELQSDSPTQVADIWKIFYDLKNISWLGLVKDHIIGQTTQESWLNEGRKETAPRLIWPSYQDIGRNHHSPPALLKYLYVQ